MVCERASRWGFLGVSALLFVASAAVTIAWCASMSAIRGMAIVTAAITLKRLAPAGERVARAIGVVVAAGLFLIARAAGVG